MNSAIVFSVVEIGERWRKIARQVPMSKWITIGFTVPLDCPPGAVCEVRVRSNDVWARVRPKGSDGLYLAEGPGEKFERAFRINR